jgi:hypothetical protein
LIRLVAALARSTGRCPYPASGSWLGGHNRQLGAREEGKDQSATASACDAESKEEGEGVMKDQITTLMEAVRLMSAEFERFNRHGQGRDATLNAVEKILNDTKVTGAVATIAPLVDGPSLVPDDGEQTA